MAKLSKILQKQRPTTLEIIRALKEEFINYGYEASRESASDFQEELGRKHRGINKWVRKACQGRDIEDVIMDEFEIP